MSYTDPSNFPSETPEKKKISDQDIADIASQYGIEPGVVYAILQVESRGKGFDSSGRPRILFEGHKFYKYISALPDQDLLAKVLQEQKNNICYDKWENRGNAYNLDQYERLEEAISYDKISALLSASYGLGQIMGFNFKAAGFPDVESMVEKMYYSEREQLIAMFNFIKTDSKKLNALINKDWAAFALAYNGTGYEQNKYDSKLLAAYNTYEPSSQSNVA
jgi:hypothetical protein